MVEALVSNQYPTKMISISTYGGRCVKKMKWWDKNGGI